MIETNSAILEVSDTPIGLRHTPSVFKGEVPLVEFHIQNEKGENIPAGKLWGIGGVLSFEGDCEESAKVFFDQIIQLNRSFLEESSND